MTSAASVHAIPLADGCVFIIDSCLPGGSYLLTVNQETGQRKAALALGTLKHNRLCQKHYRRFHQNFSRKVSQVEETFERTEKRLHTA